MTDLKMIVGGIPLAWVGVVGGISLAWVGAVGGLSLAGFTSGGVAAGDLVFLPPLGRPNAEVQYRKSGRNGSVRRIRWRDKRHLFGTPIRRCDDGPRAAHWGHPPLRCLCCLAVLFRYCKVVVVPIVRTLALWGLEWWRGRSRVQLVLLRGSVPFLRARVVSA